MGAPLKPRKKRKRTHPSNARHGEQNALWKLWNDPETRPMMIERNRKFSKMSKGRLPGQADGMTKAQVIRARRKAERKAERIITAMAKQDTDLSDLSPEEMEIAAQLKASDVAETLVDDEKSAARAALKEMLTIALMPGNKQHKIAAASLVLNFTKAKPASTVNSNVSGAEAFLEALAKKG